MKDAAFEAYVALYRAGLVNDNLLPLLRHDAVVDDLLRSEVEKRAAIMQVDEQMDPWVAVAKASKSNDNIRSLLVTLSHSSLSDFALTAGTLDGFERSGSDDLNVHVYLPVELPPVKPFQVYWNSKSQISVTVSKSLPGVSDRVQVAEDTWAILEASFGNRFQIHRKELPIQFSPACGIPVREQMGSQPVHNAMQLERSCGLVKDQTNNNVPYQYVEWLESKPPIEIVQNPYENYSSVSPDTPHLSLIKLPRRLDFLHKLPLGNEPTSTKAYSTVLSISRCKVDDMPFRIVQFGRLIPLIMRRFEISLIADQLSKTLLKDVGISDLNLIVTAISASSARENSNYQRLEFLGDSVLKSCTSAQLVAEYPLWHEGYLSAKKDRLVSNSRLSRAAIETGLDRFIVTKAFTGHKWRPPYVDDLLAAASVSSKRSLSSKVLADVVEALIGAAMVDGGTPKALRCLQVFLPELIWQPLEVRQEALFQRIPDTELPPTLQLLEGLIGYNFKKKALLVESMTHASSTTGTQSLERLEFLGDSILDNIVMHLLRTVLVNADFLAFICMEWATEQEKSDLVEIETINEHGETVSGLKEASTTISIPLWRFMRHMSPKLGHAQVATAKRHSELRGEINDAIQHGTHYPWALLAKLQAQKFYSDIMESLLGAMWIDSGSLDVCAAMVERMGIFNYMRRILREKVQIWHPKEEIGVLADTETVKYVIERRSVESGDGEGKEYWCRVFVGEMEIAEVGGGVSREEVKTKAAELAVKILKARKLEQHGGAEMSGVDRMSAENKEQGMDADIDVDVDAVMDM